MISKKIIASPLILAGLGLVGIFLFRNEIQQWKQHKQIEAEIKDVQKQQQAFQDTNKNLTDSIDFLNTENSKERIARQQLNLKKDGEIAINFPDKNSATSTAVQNNTSQPTSSNIRKWWSYLNNK